MDIATLKRKLGIDAGGISGPLDLTPETPGDENLTTNVLAFFDSRLRIKNVSLVQESTDVLVLAGKAPFLNDHLLDRAVRKQASLPVRVDFRIVDEVLVTGIWYELESSTLNKIFPALPKFPQLDDAEFRLNKTLFELLGQADGLTDIRIVLQSADDRRPFARAPFAELELHAGMNVVAHWAPDGLLGAIEDLLGDGEPLTLHGPVDLSADAFPPLLADGEWPWDREIAVAGIKLEASLGVDLGLDEALSVNDVRLRAFTALDEAVSDTRPQYWPVTGLEITIDIAEHQARIVAIVGRARGEMVFSGAFDGLSVGADLAGLAGKDGLAKFLPEPVADQLANLSIELRGIVVQLSSGPADGLAIDSMGLRIAFQAHWAVVEKWAEVDIQELNLTLRDPVGPSRTVSGAILGSIEALGATFDAVIQVPRFSVSASQAEGSAIDLHAVFDQLIGFDLPLDVAIEATRLSATQAGDFEFESTVTSDKLPTLQLAVSSEGWSLAGSREDGIKVGQLIQVLAEEIQSFTGVGTIPESIAGLTVDSFAIGLEKDPRRFHIACQGSLPIGEESGSLEVRAEFTQQGSDYTISGTIVAAGMEFALKQSLEGGASTLLGSYTAAEGGGRVVNLRDFSDDLDFLPDIGVAVDNGFFAWQRETGTPSRFLFGVELGGGVGLADVPVVGGMLDSGEPVGFGMQMLVASGGFSADNLEKISEPLPPTENGLAKGLHLAVNLDLGGRIERFFLPLGDDTGGSGGDERVDESAGAAREPDNDAHWIAVQRSFGPLHIARIGAGYSEQVLSLLLDASVGAGGLSISLNGLAISSPLDEFKPGIDLAGIGLGFDAGPISISGAFMRNRLTADGVTYDSYDGAATLKTPALSLAAIGSYAEFPPPDGDPSLFLYAVLNAPLGGPAFFFVKGLAAGFGYNRDVLVPPISGVESFPLVAAAARPEDFPDATELLNNLIRPVNRIPPSVGTNWLAVGLRFSSFQLFESTGILIARLSEDPEFHLLGIASLKLPKKVPGAPKPKPYLYAELAFKVSIKPIAGVVTAEALLTDNSFVIDRACQLRGGFAFYVWFGGPHVGDFVLTLGGYHPKFRKPAHYPLVPRLGITWPISTANPTITIKGEAYFALTPSCVMAGGALEAIYKDGALDASFTAWANFLINWEPFFYDIDAGIHIKVSYRMETPLGTATPSTELSADIHIWGPEFAGTAHVSWTIISFDVEFGAYAAGPSKLDLLIWKEFRDAFLPPANEDICRIQITSGLLREIEQEDEPTQWVVKQEDVVLATESLIPSSGLELVFPDEDGEPVEQDIKLNRPLLAVGVRPMGSGRMVSVHRIELRRLDVPAAEQLQDLRDDWSWDDSGRRQGVPKELWGTVNANAPPQPGAEVLPKRLTGLTGLRPRAVLQAGPPAMAIETFEFDPITPIRKLHLAWQAPLTVTHTPLEPQTIYQRIGETLATASAVRGSVIAAASAAGFAVQEDSDLSVLAQDSSAVFQFEPMLAEDESDKIPGSTGVHVRQEPPVQRKTLRATPLPEPVLKTIVRLLAEIYQHGYVEPGEVSSTDVDGFVRTVEDTSNRAELSTAPRATALRKSVAAGQSLVWSLERDEDENDELSDAAAAPVAALRIGKETPDVQARVVSFDRYGGLLDDKSMAGAKVPLGEQAAHVVVTGQPAGEQPKVFGWRATSSLIRVLPRVFVGDGVTVKTQAGSRRRLDEPEHGLLRGAGMVENNLARAASGDRTRRHSGWFATTLPAHVQTLAVFTRRSDQLARPGLGTRVETWRVLESVKREKLRLTPVFVAHESGEEAVLLYRLPANIETSAAGYATVKVQATGGAGAQWEISGVQGIDASVFKVRQGWARGEYRLKSHVAGDSGADAISVSVLGEAAA